jgi:uncharacterized repeat protein (TIGR01451 family)
MVKWLRSLILLALLVSILNAQGAVTAPEASWQAKVDAQVLEGTAQGEAEFLVFLEQQADLRAAQNMPTKAEKGAYVYAQLTSTARRAQAPILRSLEAQGAAYQPFWVANMIWVRGDAQLVESLARRPDVARLYNNPQVRLDIPPLEQGLHDEPDTVPADATAVEWNIARVHAPEVWAAGYTGQGVVIGGQDTGYDWEHPALKEKYRGWDSATQTASHDYNWHDAIHNDDPHTPAGNLCGFDSTEPCDDVYHGTHTMGIMVGDDGGVNQIGMAPGAKWIGCRNMEQEWGTPATYSECYQWFIAPWPHGGDPFTDGDPSKAPDVINNSWSCPKDEGCNDADVLLTIVQNVRAAGILTAHAAGNNGPGCPTINTPAAIYDESFTVGSTDQNDNISSFSSRGPAVFDGEIYLNYKPDISAPGEDIYSSIPTRYGILYTTREGTSMAAPHVAGLAALLISAQPALAGRVDMLEALITRNALPRTTSQLCGGVSGYLVPNNTYGWGRIDAMAALENLLDPFEIHKSVSTYWIQTGEPLTYTIEVTQHYPLEMNNIVIHDVLPAGAELVGASDPYTSVGDTVQWSLDALQPNSPHTVQLSVQVPADGIWTIVNQTYGVYSSEAPTIVYGAPVTVTAATSINFFPFVANSP